MNREGLIIPEKSLMITGAPTTGKSTLYRNLLEHAQFTPTPDHTTREPRQDEVPNIDKVFITVEEFIRNHESGWYLEPDLDFASYNGNYYGSPVSWIDHVNNREKEKIAFITVSTEMARKVKIATGENLMWVHLIADATARAERLQDRGITEDEIKVRLQRGDSHGEVADSDLMIDTSTISIEDALKIIKHNISK